MAKRHVMQVAQVRIARPTDRLTAVLRFYRDGLGLVEIGRFTDHGGYDGVMLALPGRSDHLEFTSHRGGRPCPAPSRDNLLVFYLPVQADFLALQARVRAFGCADVVADNPYWTKRGAVTFEDPDGWRVVLCPGAGLPMLG